MKKTIQRIGVISSALLTLAISVNAQWTRNAVTGVTSLSFPTDKVGIGTPSPSFSLDIKQDANCSFRVQSKLNGSSNMILSRALSTTNCLVNYKTGLTDLWYTGCAGNDDFRIRNAAAEDKLFISQATGYVGINTITPTVQLEVTGSARINGNLRVTGNSSYNSSINVDGNITSSGNAVFSGIINTDSVYQINGKQVLSIKGYNLFVGDSAGYANTAGFGNTANGNGALRNNTIGLYNTANGEKALYSNTTGFYNTANGTAALSNNTAGTYNIANGSGALYLNTTGDANIAIGCQALYSNTTGYYNTANGHGALNINSTGAFNTANGASALYYNTTGNSNTANGYKAGSKNTIGSHNTFIGDSANATGTSFGNASAIGSHALVGASNCMVLGSIAGVNGATTNVKVGIGTSAPGFQLQLSTNSAAKPTSSVWSIASDARLKTNVRDYKEGLDVLKNIHPVWFTYTGEAGMPKETGVGVLAQELKQVAPYMVGTWNYNDGNEKSTEYLSVDNGAMTYMLINSVKELGEMNEQLAMSNEQLKKENSNQQLAIGSLQSTVGNLQSTIGNLQNDNQALLNEIADMRSCLETLCNSSSLGHTERSRSDQTSNYLQQNNPNPFKENTTIGFNISTNTSKALLKIFSMNGEEIKSIVIATQGKGQIEIAGNTLAPGVYTYVLIVDDRTVDTKQMVLTR